MGATFIDVDKNVRLKVKERLARINAEGIAYHELNMLIKKLLNRGFGKIEIFNVCGQRYLGIGLKDKAEFKVYGIPGNNLGAFMEGPEILVYGNVQDGCGNTMSDGLIAVHGCAGDVLGYSMRGGKIFVRGDVGYRAGIHMKGLHSNPTLVIGRYAGAFLGEYMAGGIILLLGLSLGETRSKLRFVGTGMHGGVIYLRGTTAHVGKGAKIIEVDESDMSVIRGLTREFCNCFNLNYDELICGNFSKIVPLSQRPYEKLYS